MSQLGDKFLASAGASKKFRIDQNTQKIMIKRTMPANVMPGASGGLGSLNGQVLTRLPERISLEIQGLGSTRLSQGERIPLGKMAVFAQFGEGVIAEYGAPDGSVICYIPVVLASVGVGLIAGDNSFILLENPIAGATYEVYAIQTPTVGNLVYEYLEQSVLAGDKHRKVDVRGVRNAVLPVAGLNKVVVYYTGAGICEYTPTELLFLNAEANDIEALYSASSNNAGGAVGLYTSVSGSMTSEAIVLSTDVIDQIEVYTDGNLYEYITIGEIDRNAR
jgi:hypothetical protein